MIVAFDLSWKHSLRKLLSYIALAVPLACMLGCGSSNSNIPGEQIIRGANRVEVFRVKPTLADSAAKDTIGGYPIISTGKEQGAEFAARLSKILLSSGVSQNQKKCGLQPGVAYRLWSGTKAVEVLVCFDCDVLWPHVVGSQVENSQYEWQDFDPVRPQLLALTKEALPDDAEIQALSPESRK